MLSVKRKWGGILALLLTASLLLSACGGSSSNQGPVTVNVTLTEFKITSSLDTFKVGTPYHFVVTNQGSVAHEFYIMPPKSGQLTQDQVKQDALAGITQEQLQAGQTATLDYTFTKAAPSGTLEFTCHLTGHYEAGMHLPITVQ